jgi:hypothetical protein
MKSQQRVERARDALTILLDAPAELRKAAPEIFALHPDDRIFLTAARQVIDWILENASADADEKTFETVLANIDEAIKEFHQIEWAKGD